MVMAPGTNRYINNFYNSQEQLLLEDLVVESIKFYGIDLYYLPRELTNLDALYGEDTLSHYSHAIPIEMYIKSVDGFEGDGVFMSKFGLEIRDQIVLTVARRIFERNVTELNQQPRPNEGDLIWYPTNQKLFQIMFVNYLPIFYPLGTLQTYTLTCELFQYSNEVIQTGIPAIDVIETTFTTNILEWDIQDENKNAISDEEGNFLVDERYNQQLNDATTVTSDSAEVVAEDAEIRDFSEVDPFSEGAI